MRVSKATGVFFKREHQEQIDTLNFFQELKRIDLSIDPLVVFNTDLNFMALLKLIEQSNFFDVLSFRDGKIFHVIDVANANKSDYAKSSQFFCFHTDGQELPNVPEIALLCCIAEGTGNTPTVFADSIQLIKILREKNLIDEVAKCDFVFRDIAGRKYRRPAIEMHPLTNSPIMNVALGSNQCTFESNSVYSDKPSNLSGLYEQVSNIAETELTLIPHFYKTGQVVVFDNNRIIHGRGLPEKKYKIVPDKKRHLGRMWLNYKK